jgi:hypothetical protein
MLSPVAPRTSSYSMFGSSLGGRRWFEVFNVAAMGSNGLLAEREQAFGAP